MLLVAPKARLAPCVLPGNFNHRLDKRSAKIVPLVNTQVLKGDLTAANARVGLSRRQRASPVAPAPVLRARTQIQ